MVGRSNRCHDERLSRTVIVTSSWSRSSSHDTGRRSELHRSHSRAGRKVQPAALASRPGQDLIVMSEDAPDFRQHVAKWHRLAPSN
jgi:hypothetical protein